MTRINQDIPESNDGIFEGDDIRITAQVLTEDQNIKDLTNAVVYFGLAPDQGRSTVLSKDSSSSNDVTVTDAANGEIEIVLTENDTSSVGAGVYYYEIEVEDNSGLTSTVTTGEIKISSDTV